METMMFGELLGKLLYLSNQKKSALAKYLGYDLSYISKWINSKNLPSSKNANSLCKEITKFIVSSLNEYTTDDIIKYFEFEIDDSNEKTQLLSEQIEEHLKSSYMATLGEQTKNNLPQDTYAKESYNSKNYINPRLRKRFLTEDINNYMENDEILEIIICVNLIDMALEEKIPLLTAKKELSNFEKCNNLKIKFLTGLDYTNEDILMNSIILINMITSYNSLNFDVYNCEVAKSVGAVAIKDKLLYLGIVRSDGINLLINTSKEQSVANEFYFSIENMLKSKGNLLCEYKSHKDIIRDTTYLQYVIGQNLRWVIGHINEFFLPEDLFMEIAETTFKDDPSLLEEVKKINIFLQNITFNSNLKVLLYESSIKKYLFNGELSFFNIQVNLSFEQRIRHMKYLQNIIDQKNDIQVRIIDLKLENELNSNDNISMLLSNNFKIISTTDKDINNAKNYAIANDNKFKSMCDDLFTTLWDKCIPSDSNDKHLPHRICETINCMKIMDKKNK